MKKSSPTVIDDPEMIALIEEIVRTHHDAAQRHRNAGEHERARTELAKAELIAAYLPPTLQTRRPRRPAGSPASSRRPASMGAFDDKATRPHKRAALIASPGGKRPPAPARPRQRPAQAPANRRSAAPHR